MRFPDLSGERFEQQVHERACLSSYVELLAGPGGILLFVTADQSLDGITILDLAPILSGTDEAEGLASIREWTPEIVPRQVQLVELLQFLQQPPFERRRRRVAVLVSAWDVIKSNELRPNEWLARELPLLNQFLTANPQSFEFRVYGVSAQGGDVKSEQREMLLKSTPSERIICTGPETAAHDLTSPIVWLMSEESSGR